MAIFGFSEDKSKAQTNEFGKVGESNVGSKNKPVYIENGKPTPCNSLPEVTTSQVSVATGFSAQVNQLRKYGNVVELSLGVIPSQSSQSWRNIGTIPEGYRPTNKIKFPAYIASSLQDFPCEIQANGIIRGIVVNISIPYEIHATWIV